MASPWTAQYNAPGNASTPLQYGAIQAGANKNSLVSQLFAGKSVSQSPNVVAASSQVKSTTNPTNPTPAATNISAPTGQPNQTVAASPGNPGYTYVNGLLTTEGGKPVNNPLASQTANPGLLNSGDPQTNTSAGSPQITPPATFTTPSGAVVDTNGNTISAPAQNSALNTATSGLLNSAGQNTAIGQNAANIGADYGKRIADIGQQAAINEESVGGQGMLPVALGRAQQIAQTANAAQTALATGEAAALQGTGQQLTGQAQAQSGLADAGGLASPSNEFLSTSYGNQILDANGQPVGGSGGALQTAVANAIQQIKNGAGYDAANSSLNAFGPAGTNALLSALGPGFNINASNAEAATQAANIQTGGTAATSAAASGLQSATQNYVNANTAYTAAQNQAENLQQVLNSTGINANPQFANLALNKLQNQLGSTNYTSFITALTEMQQKYTTLLSAVGAQTPTVNGQQATDILNANSTPAQINAAIDALNKAAYAQLKPLYDQIGTYQSQLTSGSNINSNSNANSNPTGWF